MRPCAIGSVVLLAALALAGLPAHAATSWDETAAAQLGQATEGQTSGVAVLVARDGKIVFQDGFGYADVEKKKQVTPDTRFWIGSITKQFTAAAILRLAEQGKLALDDPLAKYFSGFAYGQEITLRHLLNHTSGLHSYTDKPEFPGRVEQAIEPAELIAWFRDDPADFAPGAGFHYSNSAYFLLGEIVGKVAGKHFGEYLRAEFFVPLGMKDTGMYANAAPGNLARGYSWNDGKVSPARVWDMSWTGGAGGLYSTVGDLFRWNEALFGGRVLNAASFEAATTPVDLPEDVDGMKYGYGFVMFELARLPAIAHSGGFDGWSSDLLRMPEQHVTVAVLSNAMPPPPGVVPAAISRALATSFLADEIAKLPPLTENAGADPKTFNAFVGRYDYQSAVMEVTVEGDGLFAQLTGQPKLRIFPRAPDEFFWKAVDATVVFVRDEAGRVVAARHTQSGNVFTAPRLEDVASGPTPEQLDACVGKYQYGPGMVLTVTRDGGQLLAQLTGQPQFPIFPKSPSKFAWRVVEAEVEFVRGEGGRVTKAIHTQNGTSFEAPRVE